MRSWHPGREGAGMTHQRRCWPETGSHSADLVGRWRRGSAPGGEGPVSIRGYRIQLGGAHQSDLMILAPSSSAQHPTLALSPGPLVNV